MPVRSPSTVDSIFTIRWLVDGHSAVGGQWRGHHWLPTGCSFLLLQWAGPHSAIREIYLNSSAHAWGSGACVALAAEPDDVTLATTRIGRPGRDIGRYKAQWCLHSSRCPGEWTTGTCPIHKDWYVELGVYSGGFTVCFQSDLLVFKTALC